MSEDKNHPAQRGQTPSSTFIPPLPFPVGRAASQVQPVRGWVPREDQPGMGAGLMLLQAVTELDADRVARLLMRDPIDVNVHDRNGMTALHHAAFLGARPCIRLLVASGKCDYLFRDKKGRYAFELAAEFARDYAVTRLLMKKQAQQAHEQGAPAYVARELDSTAQR